MPGLHKGSFSGVGRKKLCAEYVKIFNVYFLKCAFHTEISAIHYYKINKYKNN